MSPDDKAIRETIVHLYEAWIAALEARQYDWFERHLAEDYSMTARPFANVHLDKRQFIEVDKKIASVKMRFLEVFAHRAGDVVLSHAVAKVQEEAFSTDPGPGLPSAAELGELFKGKTLAYASAWRQESGIWKCFDHHLIGVMD